MPFNKQQTRRIYITALIISFLLIVGSIFLHLRQKTHLGRMSFNLDRDRVKPTSGVEAVASVDKGDSKIFKDTDKLFTKESNNAGEESSSAEDNDSATYETNTSQFESLDDINNDSKEYNIANINRDKSRNINKSIEEMKREPFEEDTNACLRCLCMTINECRATFCGSGNPCGLYRISKSYWIDSGKPTISGGSTDNEDQDYLTCVNEDSCSATAIQNYYNRYRRDCNKDGIFDCRDQIALHILGPSGCLTKYLSRIHTNRMKNCLIESKLNHFSYSYSEEEEDDEQ